MFAVEVGAVHADAHLVAQLIAAAEAAADEAVVALVKLVVVVEERAQGNHTLTAVLRDFNVEAKLRHAADRSVKFLSEAVGHKFHLLVLDAGALGLRGQLLHGRGVFAEFFILVGVGRASAFGIAREESVDHRIGIATDGRGEVCVVLEHESVVADVVNGVAGLLHGAQGHHFDDCLFLLALHIAEHAVQTLRNLRLGALGANLESEFGDEGTEFLQLFGVGHIVDAVGQGLGLLALGHAAYHFGHTAVGQEHEFLHQFVGILGHFNISGNGVAFFVNFEAHLGSVETDTAVLETFGAHRFCQAVERDEFLNVFAFERCAFGQRFGVLAWLCEVFGRGFAVAFERILHFLVGESAVAANDGVSQVPVLDIALLVDDEDGAVGQFLLIGTERADEVAETFGQHRDGAVHQVDTCGALLGFAVDDAAFGDVVGHVGNVHAHFPPLAFEVADGEGIVKVLGIVGVDGEGRHFAEILAASDFLGRDVGRKAFGSILHVLRIAIGQSVFGQDAVHLGVVLALASEDVNDLADGALRVGGPFRYLDHRLVALLAVLEFILWNKYVGGQRAVLGDEETKAFLHLQFAHESVLGALQNFDDLGLARMSVAACQHRHLDAVAVEGVEAVALAHEDGLAAVVGHEGVAAVAFALKRTLHHLRAHGAVVGAAAVGG